MTIIDLRSLRHEERLERVTGALQATPTEASLYRRNLRVPAARIQTYPKRRKIAAPRMAPVTRLPQTVDVSYADFIRLGTAHARDTSIAV
ncbi:hypothetical protein [Frondihabitans peucedani]|uniref:Uncharacterized protein n=1 Tax=Frondihabitans peucedani TaxID=598626 RepID=A0ABP8E3M2_9MICO